MGLLALKINMTKMGKFLDMTESITSQGNYSTGIYEKMETTNRIRDC
jgi:hypothetical protein